MYAAAAGASLGSRQARKQQRLQNTKNAAILQQTLKDKLAAAKALQAPSKSRPFHQLPANYLRTPAGQARKASIGQQSTSNSRLLLPITETSSVASSTKNIHQLDQHLHRHRSGTHLKSPHHSRHASFNHKSRGHLSSCSGSGSGSRHPASKHPHHPHYHLNLNPDCAVHGSCSQLLAPNQRLNRSATATLPLNDLNTPPSTPLSRHPKDHDPSSAHLLAPLLDQHKAQHRNSFSTLQLATGHHHSHHLSHHQPDPELPLTRRTSEADFRRDLHPTNTTFEPIIITPATPIPSPHKQLLNEAAGGGGGTGLQGAEVEEGQLLIDLRPSVPTVHVNKSTDNLSRCESPIEPPQIERKCSVYRPRPRPEQKYYYYDDESKLNENDTYYDSYGRTIKYEPDPHATVAGEPCSYDLLVPVASGTGLSAAGLEHGNSWISPEYETATLGRKHSTGICTCDHIECAQGKAAWLERGRRCSVQDQNGASCHRRWVKRNRIHDSSLGGSSDEDDFLRVLRGPSSFANAFLYVGLGTVALGLVISFVGTGEKGFKTVELRLIGPSLIGIGLICCILRILFCVCPSSCISRKKKTNKVDADYTTSLLRRDQSTGSRSGNGGSVKRVQIARGPNSMQKFPSTHSSHRLMKTNSKTMEGMEALRQIAATSLLIQGGGGAGGEPMDFKSQLQMQQSSSSSTVTGTTKPQAFSSSNSLRKGNRVVPIIKEPESILDDQEDVKRFDAMSVDIFNLSDGDDEDEEEENSNSAKSPEEDSKASVIHRIIEPGPSSQPGLQPTGISGNREAATNATTLRTINEKNHTEIEPGGSGGGGSGRTIVTTVAEVTVTGTSTSSRTAAGSGTSVVVETHGAMASKLCKERAPLNLGAIQKTSAGRLSTSGSTAMTTMTSLSTPRTPSTRPVVLSTQATPTTLLDAVLIETSLCEPISPSFTINLPNVPMSPPANFSISDKSESKPLSAFPFPPNFAAAPGGGSGSSASGTAKPSTATQQQQLSSLNRFSYQLPGMTSQSNNSRSGGGAAASSSTPSATASELELVLSPAKLGQ